MSSYQRIPANVPIEFLKQDGLPFEATVLQSVDGAISPMDLSDYTGTFKVLSKAGGTVYESNSVGLSAEGVVTHTISPATVAAWDLCPDRYFIQITPPIGNPLTIFNGPFFAREI